MPMAGSKWTPAQRKKFMRTMKAQRKATRAFNLVHKQPTPTSNGQAPSDAVHFLHGELRERIRSFAERIDVPLQPLTERMGQLLLGAKRKIPRA